MSHEQYPRNCFGKLRCSKAASDNQDGNLLTAMSMPSFYYAFLIQSETQVFFRRDSARRVSWLFQACKQLQKKQLLYLTFNDINYFPYVET